MANRPKDYLGVTPPPRPSRDSSSGVDVDVEKLWKSLDKMASVINRSARHTEQIPDIKRKVEDTGTKVVELDTKMTVATERISRVETKVDDGHSCQKEEIISEIKENQRDTSQKIDIDVQKGVRRSSEIASIRSEQEQIGVDLQDIKQSPRRMFYGLIGIVITILMGSGGALWFLAELNKDVEFERTQREQQLRRIESSMKTLGDRADPTPVKLALEDLEDELEESSGSAEEYNALCKGMLSQERRVLRKVFTRRNKRVPVSCLQ